MSHTELQGPWKGNSGCSQRDILIELITMCSSLQCCPPLPSLISRLRTSHSSLTSARLPYDTWLYTGLRRGLSASVHTLSRVDESRVTSEWLPIHSVETPQSYVKPCHVMSPLLFLLPETLRTSFRTCSGLCSELLHLRSWL